MQETISQNNYYKYHISGLKGFACIMVMIGHYIGLYKYAENFSFTSKITNIFDVFLSSKLNFILDESFWVVLFFVASGYLVAMSNITTIKSFAQKSIMRFLRLGIPVLFAYAVIFLLYKTIGFHTSDTVSLLENSFIQKAYTSAYSVSQVLTSPFDVLIRGKTYLNSPFWVLREMFFLSLLIYLFSLLKNKLTNKTVFLTIVFGSLLVSFVLSNVVFASIAGMLLYYFEKDSQLISNKISVLAIIIFCASLNFVPRNRISCVFFGALILLIPKLPLFNAIFSCRIAQFINKISFGIYAFHWPIFCSIGMLMFVKLCQTHNLFVSGIISSIISVVLSLLSAIIFYYVFEKQIYVLLNKLNKKSGGISK